MYKLSFPLTTYQKKSRKDEYMRRRSFNRNIAKIQALAEYKNPLSYMSSNERQRLRNTCILIALAYTLIGGVLSSLIILTEGTSGGGLSLRSSSMDAGIVVAAIFVYGVFRLCTIKRSMIHRRRDYLVRKYEHIV
jgi:hypothetical protein